MNSEKASLLGIIYKPALQFQRLNENPNFGLALVINTLLSAIVSALLVYVLYNFDPEMLKTVLKKQGISQEMFHILQNALALILFFVYLIAIPLGNVIGAFFCWVFVMILGGQTTFKKMFAVNVYSGFIPVVQHILTSLLYFAIPALFGSPFNLVISVIFMVWFYFVLATGLKETTSLSAGRAWGIVITFFLIGLIGIIFPILMLPS